MKSHDCHVFMQRLIPIAFAELLKPSVHGALCGINTFFRDICARSLRRSNVETKKRRAINEDDRSYLYHYDSCFGLIPESFQPTGRLGGKSEEYWLTVQEYNHIATYILLNCEELKPYERLFDEDVLATYPNLSGEELEGMKEQHYASWLRDYIQSCSDRIPAWIRDISHGPGRKVIC
ncbi:PREDICTED: uncharacterized protein LOC104798660 [Tarenaya hassleriana]|uniref:uncharacterized protein LOC104798660 n=1 Tax=Tarenaya hassleriana TaxID=28532 RepID=UPI00053C97CE|nr:PREDICTED: uncharacterized protein LOC104798660 [Tarenaya hassleriana]